MDEPRVRALLDAYVLYPFTSRDTLLRATAVGVYGVRWPEQILGEARRELVAPGWIDRLLAGLAVIAPCFSEFL